VANDSIIAAIHLLKTGQVCHGCFQHYVTVGASWLRHIFE